MKNQESKILNRLIDCYETRAITGNPGTGCPRIRKRIDAIEPLCKDERNTRVYSDVKKAVERLRQKGYIRYDVDELGVVSWVELNTQKVNEVYAYLSREPKASKDEKAIELFQSYLQSQQILCKYCTDQIDRIKSSKNVHFFEACDLEASEKILKTLSHILNNKEEIFEREMSANVLGDSKEFTKIKDTIGKILVQYGGFENQIEAFDYYHILSMPRETFMKGRAIINISGQAIDLSSISCGIGLFDKDISAITTFAVNAPNIITIENLTTFHAFNDPDYFSIYLAGYHSSAKKALLKKIYEQNSKETHRYYHFGDIDAGGFKIFNHLCEDTGIAFTPYKMDVETLAQNKSSWKGLTSNDVAALSRLSSVAFSNVIEYMLKNNCKLEQENIVL